MSYSDIAMVVIACLIVALVFILYRRKKRVAQEKIQEITTMSPSIGSALNASDSLNSVENEQEGIVAVRKKDKVSDAPPIKTSIKVLHVMSKENATFSGYELLQVLLSAGLRFGERDIFHCYREPNEQKDVLFSLASATKPGVFDIHNMNAFSCVGLTLFMQTSGDECEDQACYDLMLETAQHLAEDLHGVLLDENRHLLSSAIASENIQPQIESAY